MGCRFGPSGDADCISELERQAAAGAKVVKLHPTMQRFYPDDPSLMGLYVACERLGVSVFFHTGRAGIEPESTHRYALPRHYEGALSAFPKLQFIVGHAGARDAKAALQLALRYENAWLGIHGQGISVLDEMIRKTGGTRMLFGTDWPFYHLSATLAKVLLVTQQDRRYAGQYCATTRGVCYRGEAPDHQCARSVNNLARVEEGAEFDPCASASDRLAAAPPAFYR